MCQALLYVVSNLPSIPGSSPIVRMKKLRPREGKRLTCPGHMVGIHTQAWEDLPGPRGHVEVL